MIYSHINFTAMVSTLMVALVACAATSQPSLQPVRVAGIAMEPTLKKGDRILISKEIGELKRSDIITYRYPADESQNFISRVIGLPNEEIEIRDSKVLINGKILEESYVNSENNQYLFNLKSEKIPEGSYFVMGDNRDHSNDSRIWGALEKKFIYGKLVRKY